jgi:type I restriction enzyme S subunit
MDGKFLLRALQSKTIRFQFEVEATGITRYGIDQYAIGSAFFPVPPISEQQAIAAYLDHQTAKIDVLIAKKERLLDLLAEQRAALISQAVTKGLNPNVKMKDSGIPILGQVPEHWEVKRVRFTTKEMSAGPFGSSLTKDMYTQNGYRVYGQEQVIPNDFSVGDYYVSEEKFRQMQRYAVKAGDVLVSCVGTFGKVAVVPQDIQPGIINPRLVKLTPNTKIVRPHYLGLFLRSPISFMQMELESHGGTMDIITLGMLSDLVLPVPTLDEQEIILSFIDYQTKRLIDLATKVETAIERLREYRAALISSAVTGKIQVT